MILDTLASNPEIGMATSFGSVLICYLDMVNPILSFISLCIGIAVGITTLIVQINKVRKS